MAIVLRRLGNGPGSSRAEILGKARECMRECMADYAAGDLHEWVALQVVPPEFIDRLLSFAGKHPALVGITKEEFLEALSQERPDCAPALRTADGDRWFELVCGHLVKNLPARLPGMIFDMFCGR